MEPQISALADIQEELRRAQQDRRAFSNPAERATHLRLFFAWLPKILQDASGIPWDQLPSQAMGHLVRTVADHPDAIPIALAVGCARISQLRDREVWMRFVSGRQLSGGESRLLATYASVAFGHLRTYFEHLDERDCTKLFATHVIRPRLVGSLFHTASSTPIVPLRSPKMLQPLRLSRWWNEASP